MPNAIFFNSYKLKKGSSVPDFLHAVENLVNGYMCKQKGFISFMLLNDGDTWADLGIFETMEDAKNFENPTGTNEYAEKFYSFLNFSSCISRVMSVEKDYQLSTQVPQAVTFVSFKLRKGASVPDFLLVKEKVGQVLPSTHNGCIASKLLTNGSLWADLIFWKSMDDANNAAKNKEEAADVFREYLSFIGQVPYHRHFTVMQITGR
ncbi:MAG: hypothetical protein FWC32_02660 [Firmicutes bacterium]|nr:hypothetical protein [Bacillota bacterium]